MSGRPGRGHALRAPGRPREALGPHVTRLHSLLDDYGAAELATVVETALERRRTLRQLPPVPVVLPADRRVRDLDVPSHPLETYDALIACLPPIPPKLGYGPQTLGLRRIAAELADLLARATRHR